MSDFDRLRAAEMLASNPLWSLLLADLKTDAVDTWRSSTTPAQREEMWQRHKVITDIETRLEQLLNEARIQQERQRKALRREQMA